LSTSLRRSSARALFLAAACCLAGCGLTEAAHLLTDARRPAHELREGLSESTETIAGEHVALYRPNGVVDPPPLVLCAGAVEAGIDDPRFVALARALAHRGFLVATPDLRSLRKFHIDDEDPVRIANVALGIPGTRKVALSGISIGGSYCLVAAARPELRERVSCVLSFGGYADLRELLDLWLTAPVRDAPGVMDPAGEGRQRVLEGNRQRIDPALYDATMASGEPLTAEQSERLLAGIASKLAALSPVQGDRVPGAPVFLLHGSEDPIVSAADATKLEAHYKRQGVRVRLLVTDLFTHVDRESGTPSVMRSLPLLRFVAAFLNTARR